MAEKLSEQRQLLIELQENGDTKKAPCLLDGFDECILYYTYDEDDNIRAVYCYEDLVEHFAKNNNCSYTEAVEFIDYNTMRTLPYMHCIRYKDENGKEVIEETTIPLITHRLKFYETNLDESYFKED